MRPERGSQNKTVNTELQLLFCITQKLKAREISWFKKGHKKV